MINRGRRKLLYLYELTEQDLVLAAQINESYSAGNILIFANKKEVSLGQELARADDFDAAIEYLDNSDDLIAEHCRQLEEALAAQQEKLSQRDGLLNELADDLESQKSSNQILIAQLEQVKAQIEIERLSRAEAVDDLQQVSAETHSLDVELAKMIDEKYQLEQELAAKITDLVELDLQNVELKRTLENQTGFGGQQKSLSQIKNPTPKNTAPSDDELTTAETLTMASGKQIHIYHDFPTLNKTKTGRFSGSSNILRFIVMIIIALAIAGIASIITTSRLYGISWGESLDLLLKSLGL